tara:strand:+ start:4190 stop:4456 length:267 start_codon:yes stop_codon:yes gene_type:complete
MYKIVKKLISHANELSQWIPDEPNLASEEDEDIFTRMWDQHEAIIKEAEKLLEEVAAIQEKVKWANHYAEKWDEYIQEVIKRTLPQED